MNTILLPGQEGQYHESGNRYKLLITVVVAHLRHMQLLLTPTAHVNFIFSYDIFGPGLKRSAAVGTVYVKAYIFLVSV